MSLSSGETLLCESTKDTLTVRKLLGEGGQGAVYLVDGRHGQKAVKWYHPDQATKEQRKSIAWLANRTPLPNFVWPLDVVSVAGDQTQAGKQPFGYLMDLIDRSRFAEGSEVWAGLKPEPTFRVLIEICRKAAESYRDLHREGLCYRDISFGNLQFDPRTGDVLICDNDNVGVNNQGVSQIAGTWEFMAPEVILRKANPSSDTDLHSLGVLYFYLWTWHHPLHGMLEYNVRSWDDPAKEAIYGKNPVFIFDQSNTTNALPSDPDYKTPVRRWKLCPEPLRNLFTRAFTEGCAIHSDACRWVSGSDYLRVSAILWSVVRLVAPRTFGSRDRRTRRAGNARVSYQLLLVSALPLHPATSRYRFNSEAAYFAGTLIRPGAEAPQPL